MRVGREGEVERSQESLDAWGVSEERGFEHGTEGCKRIKMSTWPHGNISDEEGKSPYRP